MLANISENLFALKAVCFIVFSKVKIVLLFVSCFLFWLEVWFIRGCDNVITQQKWFDRTPLKVVLSLSTSFPIRVTWLGGISSHYIRIPTNLTFEHFSSYPHYRTTVLSVISLWGHSPLNVFLLVCPSQASCLQSTHLLKTREQCQCSSWCGKFRKCGTRSSPESRIH